MNETENCIRTSNESYEKYDPDKIVRALLRETKIGVNEAIAVSYMVAQDLNAIPPMNRTSPIIREMVNTQLVKMGLSDVRNKHARVGIPVYNISNLIQNGSKDNANMIHNPETVHKSVADEAMKEYAILHCIPTHLSDAHVGGDMHIHDLEYFAGRPFNCLMHDQRYFIRHGLKVDGTGEHTSVAKPPKALETLMNHSGEIMLAAQQNMSGGQGMSLWNVFVSPFAAGRSFEDIKQAMQMFIFNLNMAYAARGSQVPFTSVNLEFSVPSFLQDVTAYGPQGKISRAGGLTIGAF